MWCWIRVSTSTQGVWRHDPSKSRCSFRAKTQDKVHWSMEGCQQRRGELEEGENRTTCQHIIKHTHNLPAPLYKITRVMTRFRADCPLDTSHLSQQHGQASRKCKRPIHHDQKRRHTDMTGDAPGSVWTAWVPYAKFASARRHRARWSQDSSEISTFMLPPRQTSTV